MAPSLEVYDQTADAATVKPVAKAVLQGSDKHDLVLKVFRAYIADLCEQYKGGHPGYVGASVHRQKRPHAC
jgi:dihydroxyacetone synthase